jgi:membrane protein
MLLEQAQDLLLCRHLLIVEDAAALTLSLVYRFAPNAVQPYRFITPGAAIAVAAWVITSLGFSLYLAYFADYGATYGSLGAAIGLLFYLYLTASVVLFGAEVNAAISRYPLEQEGEKKEPR